MKGRNDFADESSSSDQQEKTSKKRGRSDEDEAYQYPPKSRSFAQLKFDAAGEKLFLSQNKIALATKPAPEAQNEQPKSKKRRGKKTAIKTSSAKKAKLADTVEKSYYFKKTSETNINNKELEAYSAAVCRFIAGPEYVSPVNAYYNESGYEGVAARTMPGFKTNHEAPLQFTDTIIECLQEQHLRNNVVGAAKRILSDLEDAHAGNSPTLFKSADVSGFASSNGMLKLLKDITTQLSDPAYNEAAHGAATSFHQRLNKITSNLQKLGDQDRKRLRNLQTNLDTYIVLTDSKHNRYTTIEDLESALIAAKQAGINLDTIPIGEFVDLKVNGRVVEYLARDLRNYANVKGLAISLTTRYLQQEGNMNNTHFAKDGRMINFGMTNLPIHQQLDDIAQGDLFLRQKHLDTIAFTARDIRHLPILKDAQPYYWPTKKSFVANIIIDAVAYYLKHHEKMKNQTADAIHQQLIFVIKTALGILHEYRDSTNSYMQQLAQLVMRHIWQLRALLSQRSAEDMEAEDVEHDLYGLANMLFDTYILNYRQEICAMEAEMRSALKLDANLFSDEDREVMKSLATHPVFEYFKYKTILKYILTEPELYESLARLYISPDNPIGPEDQLLIDMLVDTEADKIYDVYQLVVKMPEFNQFMTTHGESAMAMIQAELSAYRDRVMRKVDKHPDVEEYERLANSINLPHIEQVFNNIMGEQTENSRMRVN